MISNTSGEMIFQMYKKKKEKQQTNQMNAEEDSNGVI
jgi:hypothetical protein